MHFLEQQCSPLLTPSPKQLQSCFSFPRIFLQIHCKSKFSEVYFTLATFVPHWLPWWIPKPCLSHHWCFLKSAHFSQAEKTLNWLNWMKSANEPQETALNSISSFGSIKAGVNNYTKVNILARQVAPVGTQHQLKNCRTALHFVAGRKGNTGWCCSLGCLVALVNSSSMNVYFCVHFNISAYWNTSYSIQ